MHCCHYPHDRYRVQKQLPDQVILHGSREDVAGEFLSYHSVAVGVHVSSSAPPAALFFLVY